MAPVIAKSTSNSVGTKKKTLGRRKVEMKKVEAPDHRHVTFSKRKRGLFQKAGQLSSLTGSEIAAVVVSECGRVFGFGTPSCDAVADRYLACLSPNQNGNDQNHGISFRDGIGSIIVESTPSTSSSYYSQNDNVHYQENGAVVGPMIAETIPSKGSPIRVLDDNILDNRNLDLAPNGNAHYQNNNAVVESMIVENTPFCSNFPQSDGVVIGSKIDETTPLSSSCSEFLEGDGYLNLMNDTVSPAEPCPYQEGFDGSEAGEMSEEMIEEMIEEMMNEKVDEVPRCNEFLTNLVRALLPTTTSSYYTSLLVMEDQDELIMDNRGLGSCYFNPYEDWRCGGISH